MTTPTPTTPTPTPTPTPNGLSTECTECAAAVPVARQPLCGEILRCGECNAELEVVSLDPLRVELAPEVQEDWGE